MGVEAAVGPYRELSPGPAVAHPSHRLTQEVGGAPSGVGAVLTQPRHQHVAGLHDVAGDRFSEFVSALQQQDLRHGAML